MAVAADRKRHSSVPKSQLEDILILSVPSQDTGVRTSVYGRTLEFLARRLRVSKMAFKDNRELLKYCQSRHVTTVVTTNAVSLETALILKGLGIVHILIGLREDLLDVCDIII